MLCPSSLRVVNYCDMPELKRMDKEELQDIVDEEYNLATQIFLPIHVLSVVSSIIPIAIIITTIYDAVFRSLFLRKSISLRGVYINLPKKKLCKCFLSIVVIQTIFLACWKILFRNINLDKGSWYFHNKRVSRLRAKVAYLNNLHPKNMSPLKGRYFYKLKAHFTGVSRKYR